MSTSKLPVSRARTFIVAAITSGPALMNCPTRNVRAPSFRLAYAVCTSSDKSRLARPEPGTPTAPARLLSSAAPRPARSRPTGFPAVGIERFLVVVSAPGLRETQINLIVASEVFARTRTYGWVWPVAPLLALPLATVTQGGAGLKAANKVRVARLFSSVVMYSSLLACHTRGEYPTALYQADCVNV